MQDESNIIRVEELIRFSKKVWQFLLFDWHVKETIFLKFKLSQIIRILRHIFFVLMFSNFVLYALSNSSYLVELTVTLDFSLKKFTGAFTYFAAIWMLVARYSCIFLNKQSIEQIMDALPKEYKKSKLPPEIDQLFVKFGKFIKIILCVHLSAIPFATMQVAVGLISDGQKTFPFEIKFPFDASGNEIYPICLLWVLITHTFYAHILVLNENVTYGLITVVSAEFKLLAAEYQKLGENSNHLMSCVKRHVELREVVEKLQKIFTVSFFINFLVSSFLICFTAFICSTDPSPMTLIFNFMLCSATTTQIFIQCFFGQLLSDSSASVIDAIYECGWEQAKDPALKKMMTLMIQRSQKGSALSLLGVYDITLEQFQNVS
jgi:hypothetical protein